VEKAIKPEGGTKIITKKVPKCGAGLLPGTVGKNGKKGGKKGFAGWEKSAQRNATTGIVAKINRHREKRFCPGGKKKNKWKRGKSK